MINIALIISSVFYIGYFPFASGTFGSFVAIIFWWILDPDPLMQFLIIIITLFIGTISSHIIQTKKNIKDPSFIVIDEFAGMFISLIFIPKNILIYLFAFILFRFFDVIKPGYIDTAQKIPYGIGVMADDVLAGISTLIILHVALLVF